MKKVLATSILIIVFLSVSGCAISYRARIKKTIRKEGQRLSASEIKIELPKRAFKVGEFLTYNVRWIGVPVGSITASVNGIKKINERDCYEIELRAQTNDFCSAIYRIEDRFVSYMDVQTLATLRHEVYRREGRYKKDAVTDFDQENHRAHFKNFLDGSEKDFEIPPNVQDTLSAAYYFRTIPTKVGDNVQYYVCNNEANYTLFAVIKDKKFLKLHKLGIFEAFYLQPYAKLKGEKVKKGKVSGYFSCDEQRIPLLAIVKAPIFTAVTAELAKIEYR